MNIINRLPQHVADLIAAGEVVERPASVVKELFENSVDAGAHSVAVEIKRGGMSYIRVTDDGRGMSPQDAETAFLRHATSKLKDEYGLEAIGTLGFRGEALAAISAVSRMRLFTRERGSGEGTALVLEAGQVISREQAGCPDGSTMIAEDLFYNTPARLKYMKKDQAEGAAVTAAMIRLALSRPEVSVSYIKDGEEVFHTPGDGDTLSCIYAVLGRDFAKELLPAGGSGEGVGVSGFVGLPSAARGSRSNQFFFVNGRCVKSQLLQAALEQAYKNSLFTGRFPSCVLYLTLKLGAVDVNIHPAKTEIKFYQDKQIFDAVYRSVLAALNGERERPEIELGGKKDRGDNTAADAAPPPMPVPERRRSDTYAPPREMEKENVPPAKMRQIVDQLVFRSNPVSYGTQRTEEKAPPPPAAEPPVKPEPPAQQEPPRTVTGERPETPRQAEKEETPYYRIIGEAFNEVLIVESEDELILIDKHAAHERIIFDRLMAAEELRDRMSQQLIAPLTVKLPPESMQLLLENAELLEKAGFEADDFGGGTLLVRAMPADVDAEDAEALLSQMAEAIRTGRKPNGIGPEAEVLATVACKAAVKAGKRLEPKEWEPVAAAVMSGSVKYCPHGRPVAMRITKRQIDKNFKRIV
ncbi:MAG: DNA mismatch repair endonuclease MutL [Oscillospiraceae bacterium]|nr:DNA mismatch repair endonuclease MutL [Oscillospiraceae bacterium]